MSTRVIEFLNLHLFVVHVKKMRDLPLEATDSYDTSTHKRTCTVCAYHQIYVSKLAQLSMKFRPHSILRKLEPLVYAYSSKVTVVFW